MLIIVSGACTRRKEQIMAYGPQTTEIIAQLNAAPSYEEFRDRGPDRFCLSFTDRLYDFVSEYAELPSESEQCRKAFSALVSEGAAAHGFSFSRSTLSEWLSGARDPSITGGEAQTRANIYKLCAALDFDFELSCELFEKVFFTRPFNPKNLRELVYLYFSSADSENGIYDGSWYEKAEAFLSVLPECAGDDTSPLLETRRIISDIGEFDVEELEDYITENRRSFSPDNEYASAAEAVRQYAVKCCKVCDSIEYSDGDSIPYDSLVATALGYSQRSVQGASAPVSTLRNLPSQMTANFPTGPILRKICLGQENSFDKIYKTLCLLLFFYFFSMDTTPEKGSADFKSFLTYADRQLNAVNLPELYPRQPYGAFLLHCAASPEPLEAIGRYLSDKAREQSETSLTFVLRTAAPTAPADCLKSAVRILNYAPWAVGLAAATAKEAGPDFSFRDFAEEFEEEDPEDAEYSDKLEYLFDFVDNSEAIRSAFRYISLIPGEGFPEDAFLSLTGDRENAEHIISLGWAEKNGGKLYVRSEVRSFVNDREWFPRWSNCSGFAERFEALCTAHSSSAASPKELAAMGGRLSRLDGIPPEKKAMLKKSGKK